jgi:hypothetical protein
MAEHHELMGGKLHVYKRKNSNSWQASTYLRGSNWRVSTKEDSLSHAVDFAEDWYLGLRGKARNGELKTGKKFRDAAKHFLSEYLILIEGERNAAYVEGYKWKLRVHLLPFFGDKVLPEVTPGLVQQYRVQRATDNSIGETSLPEHAPRRNRGPAAGVEGREPPGLAHTRSRPVSPLQVFRQGDPPGVVFAGRIQDAL